MTCVFLSLLFFSLFASAAELTSSVDRNPVAVNETFTLSVRLDEQVMFGEPDFSALENSFEILSRQRQSQLSFNNGQQASYTTWQLTLMPKQKGQLLIPSFNFKGAVSDAIEITVTDKSVAQSQRQSIFTEAVLEPKTVYVQEQALLTLRFYTAVAVDNFGMTELKIPNANLTKVHESQYQKTINGINYQVVELRFALFADKSGTLPIPSVRFSGTLPDPNDPFGRSLFSRGKPMAINTDPLSLVVKPRPAGIAASEWLPSKGISIAQRWNRKPEALVVGEPITRSIVISAQGLTGAQLPPLSLQGGDGYKIYPDQPEIEDEATENGVIGKRIESYAIVPTQPGTLTLPPVQLTWWDAVSQQMRETELAAQTLTVLPAKDSQPTAPPLEATPEPNKTLSPDGQPGTEAETASATTLLTLLLISNNLLLFAALLFAGLWWRARKNISTEQSAKQSPEPPAQEKQLLKNLQQAADSEDLTALRRAILQWARFQWPDLGITTLQHVAKQADNPQLEEQFQQLDKALYAPEKPHNLDCALMVQELLKARQNTTCQAGTPGLRPLYPELQHP